MSEAFVSWSGGKDCCLAAYRALREGKDIRYLASVITQESGRLWPHMLSPKVMDMQSKAIGIPILKWKASVSTYNQDYQNMLIYLKQQGINDGYFGDVSIGNAYAKDHQSWVEDVTLPLGITPHLPLWNQDRYSLLKEIIDSNFEVILIAVGGALGQEYLGRTLDHNLLNELKSRYDNSPSGDAGYYHTFVIDGPIFKQRLNITKTQNIFLPKQVKYHYDIHYLDIQEAYLEEKTATVYSFPQDNSL